MRTNARHLAALAGPVDRTPACPAGGRSSWRITVLGKLALALVATVVALPATAEVFVFHGILSPANGATGNGEITATYDSFLHTLALDTTYRGLTGPVNGSTITTGALLHCCTASPGVGFSPPALASLPGFPVKTSAGSNDVTVALDSAPTYNTAFLNLAGSVPQAEQRLFDGLRSGRTYFALHTTQFPAGEIRGFLQPVPEPASMGLMALGLVMVGAVARRRRSGRAA